MIIKKNKYIDENLIYSIITDICLGLKDIHNKDIIHRDLKPENIFIDGNNNIKIGDFGISKQLTNVSKYAYTKGIGTINYMAPEILNGKKYNNKIDIWAL